MKQDHGQVLIPGVFFIFITMLMVYVLFNTTQQEYERQKSTNIADAAVYSGLQFQAQSLNYLAYTNRAIIANQVAVGQLVSTSSWLDYVADTSEILADFLRLIPYIGQFLATGMEAVAQVATVIMQEIPVMINITDATIHSLQMSQEAVFHSTFIDTKNIIEQVIRANDSRYNLSPVGEKWLIENINSWYTFTEYSSSEETLQNQAYTISQSMDRWSNFRNNELVLGNLPGIFKVTFNKQGQTKLVQTNDDRGNPVWNWESRDAASVNINRRSWRGWKRTEVPTFTAQNHTTGDAPSKGLWLNSEVRRSENQGNLAYTLLDTQYSGLAGYRKMSNNNNHENNNITLALEVSIPKKSIRTSDNISGIGPAHQNFNPSSNNLSAVSKGQIYFERPKARLDSKIEHSNLFNPYWVVQLVDSTQEKRTAWEIQGITRPF